jgi:hypothetical protein
MYRQKYTIAIISNIDIGFNYDYFITGAVLSDFKTVYRRL